MHAIVLDIGNVICEWNPQRLAACAFADPDHHEQAIKDTVGHPDWLELDRGRLSLQQAIENAQQRSSLNPRNIERIYRALPVSLRPLPNTVAALDAVSARGIKLHVLSNMQQHAWQYLHCTHDFWHHFDTVVVSCDCQLIKPDKAIYAHLAATAELDLANSVFVDDMAENVDASRRFGLPAVQLTDRQEGGSLIEHLLALGEAAAHSLPSVWPVQAHENSDR